MLYIHPYTQPRTQRLGVGDLTETADGRTDSGSRRGAENVGTTSVLLVAALALPDADGGALDGGLGLALFYSSAHLAARRARVARVLGDFHLLDGLTERSTVTGTVLSGDSDLLCALGLGLVGSRGRNGMMQDGGRR